MTAPDTYDYADDARKGYALWIEIMRSRYRIVRALKWKAGV